MFEAVSAPLKLWRTKSKELNIKLRKALIFSLIAPIFVTISAPIPAQAATYAASDSYCSQTMTGSTDVTVVHTGNSCVVIFKATTGNATTSYTWTVPNNANSVSILVVGGGGSGGVRHGAGGGAGGYRYLTGVSVTPAGTVSISVGKGGDAAASTSGGSSGSNGNAGVASSFGTTSAAGGGFGGQTSAGGNGGSGGGGCCTYAGGLGNTPSVSPSQGNSGGVGTRGSAEANWSGGGGGGAGSVGGNSTSTSSIGGAGDYTTSGTVSGGSGGNGISNDITGSAACYASGGGGGVAAGGAAGGAGGVCGSTTSGGRGGKGGTNTSLNNLPTQGVDGTGSGGGGAGFESTTNPASGRGGSGIVVVRYDLPVVTISANSGTGSPSATSLNVNANNQVTLPTKNTLSRSGYTFGGWNTAADGSGTNYAESATYSPTGDATLYAQWRSVISYDANGGTSTRPIDSTTATGSGTNTTLSTGATSPGGIVTSGLQLYLDASNPASYPGSGSTWFDISGNGRNATALNSPTFDPVTKSFTLNGTNQGFEFSDITRFAYSGTNPYTLSAMFKSSNIGKGEQCLICRWQNNVAGSYLLRTLTGVPESYRAGVASYSATGYMIGSSEYQYLVTTYDGSTTKIYLDGVEIFTASNATGNNASPSIKTTIGMSADLDRYLEGKIYSAQIYNVALSQSQITQNYKALLPRSLITKDGSTLTGWSTSVDSSTAVIVGNNGTLLAGLPTPYIRLEAKNYNGTTWTPTNYNGSGITYSSTKPTLNSNQTGWGAAGTFPTVSGLGSQSVGIYLNNSELSSYTFCAMARYKTNGVSAPATMGRIFAGTSVNWLSGWFSSGTKDFYHNGWQLSSSTLDYNWHYICDSGNNIYWDGVKLAVTNQTYTKFPAIAIGGGYAGGEWSDFEVSEIILYDQFLNSNQVTQVNQYFKNTYGVLAGTVESATPNMVPPTNYSSQGSSTLYARWGSTITYEGNGQTSGTPPAPQVFANGAGTLATNSGSLAEAGYNFVGWNTRADGTGTFYAPGASYSGPNLLLYAVYQAPVKIANTLSAADPVAFSPYMRFKASDYDATKKIWYDSSGNGRNTAAVRGDPTVVTTTVGNGSTKSFQVVSGGTTAGIKFNNPEMSSLNWTVFSVARYNGTQSGLSRIYDGEYGNFLFGFYNSASGVAHYGAWVTSGSNVHGTNWVLSTGYTDAYRSNGVLRGTGDAVNTLPPLTINAGQQYATEPSVWQVAETIIFNKKLSATEIQQVEDYLASTYGISGYSTQQSYSDSVTVNASAGSVTISDTYTAILGYRNSFSISPTIPGVTMEGIGTNQVRLRIANTVSTGTYWETITVTDTAGNSAVLPVRINVVPALQWSASNPVSVSSTFGKYTRHKLDLSGGFGTRVAAVAHSSSPAPRGISIDTSTISSGSIYLIVDTGTAIGTYTESITVTDGSGLIKTTILTLNINAPPDVTYSAQTDAAYPYVTQNLLINLDAANPNSYSGTGTTWTDTASNRAFTLSGSPTYSQTSGGTLTFASGKEATSSTNWSKLDTFTVETWFKLNSLSTVYPCFVTSTYTGTYINFAICQSGSAGSIRAGYHVGASAWQGYTSVTGVLSVNTWYHAAYTVSKSGTTYTGTLYLNGRILGSATSSLSPNVDAGALRIGKRWDGVEYVDGDIPVVRIYNASLSADQVMQNYQNSKVRFLSAATTSPTISGSTSLSVTAGTARDFSLFTANDGTGAKTFTLSGVNSNFRIDTSTANTAIFKVLASTTSTNTTTSKTYYETLTAVDTNGIATAYYLTVVANPALTINSTGDTLTTTLGLTGTITLNVASGTGTGASTFTRISSSNSSAITASLTSGQVVLSIAGTLPAGTYYETLTATDSIGSSAVKVLKIVINPRLTLVSDSGALTINTTYGKSKLLRLNLSGGTANFTYALNTVSSSKAWKFTLDTSTASSGYILFKADGYATIGTHTFTVSVTDSVTASASVSITVIVNENPKINDSPSTNSIVTSNLVTYLDAINTDSYPSTGTVWKDLSGNNGNFNFSGSPYYNSTGGGNITTLVSGYLVGEKNWNVLTSFTVESWFQIRYKNNPNVVECLISSTFTGTARNFSLCLASPTADTGKLRASYYANGERGVIQTPNELTTNTWYHVVYTVAQSGSNYIASLYLNGAQVGSSVSSTVAPAVQTGPLLIGKAYATTDTGGLQSRIQTIRIYDRALNTSEINTNYTANLSRVNPDAAPSTTISTTQGGSATSSAITASLGSGNKTFSVSPDNSSTGVTIDTATANSVIFRADSRLTSTDSQTARTYQQTLTATDEVGATTDYRVNVLVNPPIIETSTAPILTNVGGVITHVLTTTSGIETSTVIFASKGSSDKTFTRTGTAGSGASLTANGNQAILRVLSTINPGTYWETVTATDTTTASTSLVFKIVVNPGPTIVGRTTLTATTRTAYTSPGYFVANGTGTLKLTMSPDAAGISLDTSTAGIAYIKLTNAFTSAATYYETLTVTDANGAIGRLAVTIKVVAPVTISGNTTVVSTYGDSNLFSYNVSGSATSYNVAVAGSCITSKSTYSSGGTDYTVEQLLGANGSNTCEWVVPNGVTSITGLVIAGGGQGGAGRGGGGGAGGVVTGTTPVTPGETLTVKVGVGGSNASCSRLYWPAGCDGTVSSISKTGSANWAVAQGGGGGGGHSTNYNGRAGGSGGGAGMNYDSGNAITNPPLRGEIVSNIVPSGWTGYGNAGVATTDSETVANKFRNTGGGGGAGSPGFPGVCADKSPVCNNTGTGGGFRPDGGNATSSSITGVNKTYAGGGGGAVALGVDERGYLSAPAGNAYAGGPVDKGNAGVGATQSSPYGTNAAPNTGSGGGGSIGDPGGNGGSGLVVFRYVTTNVAQPNNKISFALVDTATGRFNMTVPESLTVGTYTQTVIISDASDVASTSTNYTTAVITIKVIQDTPTATISLPGAVTTATYGTAVTLTSAVSTNGKVTFKKGGTNISNCVDLDSVGGLATCSWTPTVVESALITAALTPTDSTNYRTSIENDSAITVVVGKADTLTVTANNLSLTYSEDNSGVVNTSTPTPTFKLTGLASIDSITAMSYSYSGLTYGGLTYSPLYQGTPSWAGMYTITPSSPVFSSPGSTSNYKNVTFAPGTLTINRAPRGSWTLTYGSGTNTITYGAGKTETPTIVNKGDGTKLFSTSSTTCSVNSANGVITTLGVGACSITAVLNQSDNWLSDTKTVTLTINRGPRTATLTPASSTVRYGDTTTVTAAVLPVLDSATVTYSAGTSLGCQIDNVTGQVTGIKAGSSCGISVLYGQTDLYESVTATANITINKAIAPVVTTETVTAVSFTGLSAIVSPTYRVSGILARDILQILPTADISNVSSIAANTYTSVSGYRYYATSPSTYDSTTAPTDGGTYQVFARNLTLLSGLDISNYETPTYVSSDLVINPIAQAPLRILLSAQESITVPYDISISGGSSTGTLSAVVVSGGTSTGCSVTGLRLSTTQPGSCVLMAIKAADRNYLQVSSDTATVVILNFVSSFSWDTVFSGTGITITSEVPIVKGPESCSVDCMPTVTDIRDLSGNSINTITVGTPFKIIGTNFNTTTSVYFSARIGGVRLSSVAADSFQIDDDNTLTVMAPANFVPNAGENSSTIGVRIVVLASGGSSFPNQQITIISL